LKVRGFGVARKAIICTRVFAVSAKRDAIITMNFYTGEKDCERKSQEP
jgi:hypothetical protein